MDMHIDTTSHLAAQAVETPARAATDKAAAMAGPADNPVSLATLLAKRNAMMDAINLRAPGDDAPDEEVTQANEAAFAVEQEILTTPCRTADDAVAKVAALVEFIREAGCPDESDVENVLADIGRVLRGSSYPVRATKVDRRDAHWALAPHQTITSAALKLTGDLATIVAAAEEYDVKFVKPANERHNILDEAEVVGDEKSRRASELAEADWQSHRDAYRAIVDAIFDQNPTTTKQLVAQVDTWGALLAHGFYRNHKADTLIGKLYEEDAIKVGEHMLASLKGMTGTDGECPKLSGASIMPLACNTADIDAIVAEAKELAKNIGPAQDAFNEANEAWTATKGEGEEGLLARQNEAESVWWHHLDRFSEAAERLFDLPAPTAADRARIVRAYADLMAPVFGVPEGDDTLASLPTENLLQVISYLDGTRPKAKANPELLAAE
ncbi:hypothetical protein [Caulobacter sp. 602-1]|uniref:hypothetical protein n=1 Tax=Caulobacter sp. 602-1 TaxID=2492472 RepID=UPI000F634F77|nr:hypothetical protein [Caulobacter sp. 602-1]RRN64672.1 hypothetical protein EIK80_11595 [Caulobacter sp. 602-1]